MKHLFVAILFVPSILFAQSVTRSQKKLNVFTLGDSNGTFPYSWPQQLQLLLPNAQIFNISRGGRTIGFVNNGDSSLNSLLVIDENLKKASDYTKERPYDYIILELGTNDAKAVFANRQQEVANNMETLIRKIRSCNYPAIKKAKIIIVSPPPYGTKAEATEKYKGGGKRVEEMSHQFKKIAARNGCIFVNGYTAPGLDMETMTADGLHLDANASRKLMDPVVAIITK